MFPEGMAEFKALWTRLEPHRNAARKPWIKKKDRRKKAALVIAL